MGKLQDQAELVSNGVNKLKFMAIGSASFTFTIC